MEVGSANPGKVSEENKQIGGGIMENKLINEFIKEFYNEVDLYEKVKRTVHKSLETKLNDSGVMALVTSRVKDAGRLKEKLIDRDSEKNYKSKEDIYSDIVDLIGLRVALYFPNDIGRVESLINNEFSDIKIKTFPEDRKGNDIYTNRFEGYSARHYRIEYEYDGRIYKVEIQVASLLMHAWAEVEHDLAYKQKKGKVSFDEYEALDEINGLIIAGEISLQRLQRLSELRMATEKEAFSNHYQLADYIYKFVEKTRPNSEIILGDVETLFKVLQLHNRLTKKKVDNDLGKIQLVLSGSTIADQMMDLYSLDNRKGSIEIIRIRASKDPLNDKHINEALIGKFLAEWIKLERVLEDFACRFGSANIHKNRDAMSRLSKCIDISDSLKEAYWHLKKTRNMLVHGAEIPEDYELLSYIDRIIEVRKEIQSFFN